MATGKKNSVIDTSNIGALILDGIKITIQKADGQISYRIYPGASLEKMLRGCTRLISIIHLFRNTCIQTEGKITIEIDDITHISAHDALFDRVVLTDLFFSMEAMGMFSLYPNDEIQHVATLQGIGDGILRWAKKNKGTTGAKEKTTSHITNSLMIKKIPKKLPYNSCYALERPKDSKRRGSSCIEINVKHPLKFDINLV
jgi:hypothetical protein